MKLKTILITSITTLGLVTFSLPEQKNQSKELLQTETFQDTSKQTFGLVDVQPEFPGGEKAMYAFIRENLKYPEYAKKNNIGGKVYMYFVVNKDGKISDIKPFFPPERHLGYGLEEEATRIISIMPDWIPATYEGVPVKAKFDVLISFRLDLGITPSPPLPPATLNPTDTTTNKKTIYNVAEVQPEFPEGEKAMFAFISKNFKYPAEAKRFDVGGRILISFVVNEDGKISDIKPFSPPEKQLGYGLEREAMRVVSIMPDWKPGTQEGKPVRVRYMLPIMCWLGEDK